MIHGSRSRSRLNRVLWVRWRFEERQTGNAGLETMRNRCHWMISSTLIPETALFDDADEVHGILNSSSGSLRSFLVFGGGLVVWTLVVASGSCLLEALLGLSRWHASLAILSVAMPAGSYWLFNYGLRRPFQRALREALQGKGIPICIDCGYDLRGQAEARCSECGRQFPVNLLKCNLTETDSDGCAGRAKGHDSRRT